MSKSPSKDTTLETRKTLAVKVCSWFQIYCLCVVLHIKQSSILISKLDHLISFPVSVTIYTDICIVDFMLYLRISVDRSTPFFFLRHLTTLLIMMLLSRTTSDVSMALEHLSWVWDTEWIRIRNQLRSQPTSQSFHWKVL